MEITSYTIAINVSFMFEGLHYSLIYLCPVQMSYDIKKLIMMQKLEPKTVGLKPIKTGHAVDSKVLVYLSCMLLAIDGCC